MNSVVLDKEKSGSFWEYEQDKTQLWKTAIQYYFRKLFNKNMGLILKQYMPIQFIYVT